MSMNNMSLSQAGTVLNAVVNQATGQSAIAAITTPEDFVSVAQTALKTGYDPVVNAVSQVWSRSIFASRPYDRKFKGLEMSLDRYGNAIRKLSPVSQHMADDPAFLWPVAYDAVGHSTNPLGNGQSVDHYKISKQEVLQTNFYGTAVYEQRYTIFKDQLDVAFSSADEFGRFTSMNMEERMNDKESYIEAVARGMQANAIGAVIDEGNSDRVVHLLTEYNAETGLSLTAQSVYQPTNFAPFMRWVYARIKTIARLMGERSEMYQTVINSKPILRHTAPSDMRIAIYAKAMDQMHSMVTADTYHDKYLADAEWEGVSYWQSIDTPDSIAIKPVYTGTDGSVTQASDEVEQAGIFGFIHDKDALGYSVVNSWAATTPLNIDGGYWNEAYHARIKTVQDLTEKAVVLLLD